MDIYILTSLPIKNKVYITEKEYATLKELESEIIDEIVRLYESITGSDDYQKIDRYFAERRYDISTTLSFSVSAYEEVLRQLIFQIFNRLLRVRSNDMYQDMNNKLLNISAAECSKHTSRITNYFDSEIFHVVILTNRLVNGFNAYYQLVDSEYNDLVATYKKKSLSDIEFGLSTFYYGNDILPFDSIDRSNIHTAYMQCANFISAYMRIGVRYEQLSFFTERMALFIKWMENDCTIDKDDIEKYNARFLSNGYHVNPDVCNSIRNFKETNND